jgi:hypothetical protein
MSDNALRRAKDAIIAGKSKEQFLAGLSADARKKDGEAYDQAMAYRDEICSDNGATFD